MSHELTASDLPQLAERLDVITVDLGDWLVQARLDNIADSPSTLGWVWGWSDMNEPDLECWRRGESLTLFGIGSMMIALGQLKVQKIAYPMALTKRRYWRFS